MDLTAKPVISVLIVNYNSAEFVAISLYALEKLTKNDYIVYIADNNSLTSDFEKLQNICFQYRNVYLERNNTNLKGSLAHGTALNYLVKKVQTPYFSILDADAIWLKKDWDEILINQLSVNVKVVGSQAPMTKPQDFPLLFAILFETEIFKTLDIDFCPLDVNKHQDTGYEIRLKYLKAGFRGKNIELKSTRIYKDGPFKDVCVAEYYLDGDYDKIFASHFARGSSLGRNKYIRTKGIKRYFYKLPLIGWHLLRAKGLHEKQKWIEICQRIVDNQ